MALSTGLVQHIAEMDKTAAQFTGRLASLADAAVRWLENDTGWYLRPTIVRTLYVPGGIHSILLPQPGTVTEVAVRYGSTWNVEDPADYTQIGEDGRDLVRTHGESWPGAAAQVSFLRTPGLGSSSLGYGVSSGTHMGEGNIRVKLEAGLDTVADWPPDLLGLATHVVMESFRNFPYSRQRSPNDDSETYKSFLRPEHWRILRDYREGRPRAA